VAVSKHFTFFALVPTAMRLWSGLMSAAINWSNSRPTSVTRRPVLTSQTTAWPNLPPRPPPMTSSEPLALKRSERA